jgi:phosphomevalonate kinase
MSADWFGAWGEWIGALATTATAVVAVVIALNSNARERKRRKTEEKARRLAVVQSLLHAHHLMAMVFEYNDQKPKADLAIRGLNAVVESALADIRYALSQPFVSRELLDDALQFQTALVMVQKDAGGVLPATGYIAVADVAKMIEPFRADIAKRKAALEDALDQPRCMKSST